MITTVLDFLFIFNVPVQKVTQLAIEKQLHTLANLYLREFELVMLPRRSMKYKTTLYDDPKINLLCPFEVESAALQTAGFSRGIVEHFEINYDPDTSQFALCDDITALLDMFTGDDTLLFIEMPV